MVESTRVRSKRLSFSGKKTLSSFMQKSLGLILPVIRVKSSGKTFRQVRLFSEQMQLVGAHFVRGFARLRIVFLYFIHICHIVGFMFPAG